MEFTHLPVLKAETIELLAPEKGNIAVDATAGAGGHLQELLDVVGPTGRIIGIDWDAKAVQNLKEKFAKHKNVTILQGNFAHLEDLLSKANLTEVDRILYDLGVASYQLDDPSYGLSFQGDEPLDMRISQLTSGITAEIIVNRYSILKLKEIIWRYGEEKFAGSIARRIDETRQKTPIKTTGQLREIILTAIPKRFQNRRIDPATKTFMALRIVVNREFDNLENSLRQAQEVLIPGGRVGVISFHSGEDRIVKRFIKKSEDLESITKKPVTATEKEINDNPRSRSAKLRVAIKK